MILFDSARGHGRGIILNTPVNGVIGIIECASDGCAWRLVLMIEEVGFESGSDKDYNLDKMMSVINDFLMHHRCGQPPTAPN